MMRICLLFGFLSVFSSSVMANPVVIISRALIDVGGIKQDIGQYTRTVVDWDTPDLTRANVESILFPGDHLIAYSAVLHGMTELHPISQPSGGVILAIDTLFVSIVPVKQVHVLKVSSR